MLGAEDRDRLVKILGMTGSSHDGEALAALRKAQSIMERAHIGWKDLLAGQAAGQAHRRPQPERSSPTDDFWRRYHSYPTPEIEALRKAGSEALAAYPFILSEWERNFLSDWEDKPESWSMSEKQTAVFQRIRLKLETAKRRNS